MAKTRDCPVCGKESCTVSRDGKSGYCKKEKRKWEVKNIPLSELKPGPIQHETLPAFLLDIAQWAYRIVGHYLNPTLEQWELGFMRDMHADREVMFWHQVAMAFITYHRRKNLPLRGELEEKKLIGSFVQLPDGEDAESKLIRDCFENPDGWKEEVERVIATGGPPDARWFPPEGLADWPTAT